MQTSAIFAWYYVLLRKRQTQVALLEEVGGWEEVSIRSYSPFGGVDCLPVRGVSVLCLIRDLIFDNVSN